MVLLICILKDYRVVEDVLLGLVELGVTGATVLEGRGMGQILGSEVPIFAGLRGLFPGSAFDSHLVVSAMPRIKLDGARHMIEKAAGPLDRAGAGVLLVLPLESVSGLAPELP